MTDPWLSEVAEAVDRAPVRFDYLAYTPDGTAPPDGWPLLVFLHGAGEKGGDIDQVRQAVLPRLVAEGLRPPVLIVCPQCPPGPGWPIESLAAFLDVLTARLPVDPRRVSVTGISMGGRGAWELAYWRASRLAAISPLCGFGIPNLAPLVARLPVWAFHGADDDVLPVARSEEMIAAMRDAGGEARLTVLPDTGHECGERVYGDPAWWDWLLAQRLATNQESA